MPGRERVFRLAAEVACSLSAGQAVALAADLEAEPAPRRLDRVTGLTAPATVISLTEAWVEDGSIPGRELASALRCAALAVKTTSSYEKIELVHTGPGLPDIRRNRQALLEVVRGSRQRLWVVSYALVAVDPVLEALEERRLSGVEVKIVIDHLVGPDPDAKANTWAQVSARLESRAPTCEVVLWPEENRPIHAGRRASLHAKCAIADGRQAFISSANLTDAAMERNLEIGCLITGGTHARSLDRYLQGLVDDSTLVVR